MSAKEYGIAYPGQSRANPPRAERAEEPRPSWHKGTAPKATVFDQDKWQAAAQADPALVPIKPWYQKPVTWIAGGLAVLVPVVVMVATSHSRSYELGHEAGISPADAPNSALQGEKTIKLLCQPFASTFSEWGTAEGEEVDYSEYMEGCVDGYHSAER